MFECARCGTKSSRTDQPCPYCGGQVVDPDAPAPLADDGTLQIPPCECGAQLRPGQQFCDDCGKWHGDQPLVAPQVLETPTEEPHGEEPAAPRRRRLLAGAGAALAALVAYLLLGSGTGPGVVDGAGVTDTATATTTAPAGPTTPEASHLYYGGDGLPGPKQVAQANLIRSDLPAGDWAATVGRAPEPDDKAAKAWLECTGEPVGKVRYPAENQNVEYVRAWPNGAVTVATSRVHVVIAPKKDVPNRAERWEQTMVDCAKKHLIPGMLERAGAPENLKLTTVSAMTMTGEDPLSTAFAAELTGSYDGPQGLRVPVKVGLAAVHGELVVSTATTLSTSAADDLAVTRYSSSILERIQAVEAGKPAPKGSSQARLISPKEQQRSLAEAAGRAANVEVTGHSIASNTTPDAALLTTATEQLRATTHLRVEPDLDRLILKVTDPQAGVGACVDFRNVTSPGQAGKITLLLDTDTDC